MRRKPEPTKDDRDRKVLLRCLCCGKEAWVKENTPTGQGISNYFCDGECEDRYAARL